MSIHIGQPYTYRPFDHGEPDWTRIPGWQNVTGREWRSVQWQRANGIKSVHDLKAVMGTLLPDHFYEDLALDQSHNATMSILVPPHLINTMVPADVPDIDGFVADPVRRYMLPVASDRRRDHPSHPRAGRDPLHETEMWATEGLIHRYPTKVLAELLSTCPQYCGHCTRMDLVGSSTPTVEKASFKVGPAARQAAILAWLRRTPTVRDVGVSGGDVANLRWLTLERFVDALLGIESVREIRLTTKALMALPQYWLQGEVRAGVERLTEKARGRDVHLSMHTHVNCAQSVTSLVAEVARGMLATGVRDVRNQGVLMRDVNDSTEAILDLCFALLDGAGIMPYYLYLCDLVPNSEHWRLALWEAQHLQESIMGYLPGFATPRFVCDVPQVGKRWVHQAAGYDRVRGISYWTKNFRTPLDVEDPDALTRRYEYWDPIYSLPERGRAWWAGQAASGDEPAPRSNP